MCTLAVLLVVVAGGVLVQRFFSEPWRAQDEAKARVRAELETPWRRTPIGGAARQCNAFEDQRRALARLGVMPPGLDDLGRFASEPVSTGTRAWLVRSRRELDAFRDTTRCAFSASAEPRPTNMLVTEFATRRRAVWALVIRHGPLEPAACLDDGLAALRITQDYAAASDVLSGRSLHQAVDERNVDHLVRCAAVADRPSLEHAASVLAVLAREAPPVTREARIGLYEEARMVGYAAATTSVGRIDTGWPQRVWRRHLHVGEAWHWLGMAEQLATAPRTRAALLRLRRGSAATRLPETLPDELELGSRFESCVRVAAIAVELLRARDPATGLLPRTLPPSTNVPYLRDTATGHPMTWRPERDLRSGYIDSAELTAQVPDPREVPRTP